MEGIQAVAARIQERALSLQSEKATLSVIEAQLHEAKEIQKAEAQGDRALKSSLLSALQSKNELELKLLETEEKIGEADRERTAIDQEIEQVSTYLKEIQESFNATKTRVYAPHDVDIALFTAKVEGQITCLEEMRRFREVKLCDLSVKAEVAREEAVAMLQEIEELRSRAFDLDRIEEKEDEESTALSLQLKATMAKRSSLREAQKEAQQLHRQANEEMLRYESQCMLNR